MTSGKEQQRISTPKPSEVLGCFCSGTGYQTCVARRKVVLLMTSFFTAVQNGRSVC